MICNLGVVGSNPTRGSKLEWSLFEAVAKLFLNKLNRANTRVAKWGRLKICWLTPSVVRIHLCPQLLLEAMQSDLYNFFERKFESFFANIKKWCTFAPVLKNSCAVSSVGRAIDS